MFNLKRITPFLNAVLPAGLAMKGLEKVDPKMRKFIGYATSAGFGADQILGYIRNQFENPNSQSHRQSLEEGNSRGTLRPDQKANLTEINQSRIPGNIAQGAASLGAGLAAGGYGLATEAASQLLPETPTPEKKFTVEEQPQLTPSGFPVTKKENKPAQKAAKEDPFEQAWNLFQKDKTNAPDPSLSAFLKIAKKLKDMRGLKDKDQFTALWDDFHEKLQSGMGLPELMGEVMMGYNQRLGKGMVQANTGQPAQKEQPSQGGGMQQLMAAVQAAQQARQKRQKPPM